MSRSCTARTGLVTALIALPWAMASCMPPGGPIPATGADASPSRGTEPIPPGYGSLRQADITLDLRAGAVQVRVTPLAPSVIRLTAPDTWERLSAIRARAGGAGAPASVFLVSVQTEAAGGALFDPRDVLILSRGTLHRPTEILGLTPGWGAGPLRQRTVQQALYLFPPAVDPGEEMEVRVGDVRNTTWRDRLPRLEAERARVRARAGG